MINRALLKKSLFESALLLIACSIAIFLLCFLHVWFVSRLELSDFAKVIEPLWEKYNKFSPVSLQQLLTYPGRIARAFSEPMVTLCIAVWAVARGSDVVSGELGRGSMEMLLAQPLSRIQTLLNHTIVTAIGLVVLCIFGWLGIYTGIQNCAVKETVSKEINLLLFRVPNPLEEPEVVEVPMSEKAEASVFVYPTLNLFFLGFCLVGISTLVSSWDRYRLRTIGIVIAFWVIQITFRLISMSIVELHWLGYFTIFSAYDPEVVVALAREAPEQIWSFSRTVTIDEKTVTRLGPMGYNAILASIGGLGLLAGGYLFHRRDLPAPL